MIEEIIIYQDYLDLEDAFEDVLKSNGEATLVSVELVYTNRPEYKLNFKVRPTTNPMSEGEG